VPHRFSLRLLLASMLAALALVPVVALADELPPGEPPAWTGDDPGAEDPDAGEEWVEGDEELEEFIDDIPPLTLVQDGKRFGIALGFDADDETLVPAIVLLREVGKGRCVVAGKKVRKAARRGRPCDGLAARTPATVVEEWDAEVDGLPTVLLHHDRVGAYRVYVTASDVDGSEFSLSERFVVGR